MLEQHGVAFPQLVLAKVSGKPLSNGFDGSTGTAFEGDTSGATVTVPVSMTIVKGGVKVYAVTSSLPLVVLLKNGGYSRNYKLWC